MKNIFTILLIAFTAISFSQAFSGKGDQKGQVGFSAQNGGTGINVAYDTGIGENISIGLSSVYLLNSNNGTYNLEFTDRFDIKARFNANIGNVLTLPANVDIYPGLNLGLRNFGAHLGARYFFTDGFGIFSEVGIPLAKYDKTQNLYNNQFVFNIGASFNL
ncbi:MAG: hypothetical protein RLZZ312_1760 [Bacteroidota bacterium]|jgi:hypothetical protein